MNRPILILIAITILIGSMRADERITAEAFQKIAAAPGDDLPLQPELAKAQPFWRKSEIVIICSYSDGHSTTEKLKMSAKTVWGRYIVFTIPSEVYGRQIDSIMGYNAESATIKTWGLYGTDVTEATLVYDATKRIYSIYSHYFQNGDFTEIGVGSFSDTEMSDRTSVMKDGKLFMVRVTMNTPLK